MSLLRFTCSLQTSIGLF